MPSDLAVEHLSVHGISQLGVPNLALFESLKELDECSEVLPVLALTTRAAVGFFSGGSPAVIFLAFQSDRVFVLVLKGVVVAVHVHVLGELGSTPTFLDVFFLVYFGLPEGS